MKTNLLSVNSDSKTKKGNKSGYLTGILYLIPAGQHGLKNLCPWASEGCKSSCLVSAGRGRFNSVQQARIKRTKFLMEDEKAFIEIVKADLHILVRQAHEQNKKPAVRLMVRPMFTSISLLTLIIIRQSIFMIIQNQPTL